MATIIIDFIADSTGNFLAFKTAAASSEISVDNISLKEVLVEETVDNYPVKEFLTGTTDEGEPIFFRADSQQIQLKSAFEEFSSPTAILNRTQRGTLMKCFVALDDEDFYEIQGTVSKGVSILKVHSRDRGNIPTPPIAREIRISWRDSSKQLCRLIQSAVVFTESTIDFIE